MGGLVAIADPKGIVRVGDITRVKTFATLLVRAGFSCKVPLDENRTDGNFAQELAALNRILERPCLSKMLLEMPGRIGDAEYRKTMKFAKLNREWFARVELSQLPHRHQGVLTVLRDEFAKAVNPDTSVVRLDTYLDEAPEELAHKAQSATSVLANIFEGLAATDFPVEGFEELKTRFSHLRKVNALRHEAFLDMIADSR